VSTTTTTNCDKLPVTDRQRPETLPYARGQVPPSSDSSPACGGIGVPIRNYGKSTACEKLA
jgi:hypothetical protein